MMLNFLRFKHIKYILFKFCRIKTAEGVMNILNMTMIEFLEEIWAALEVPQEQKVGGDGYSGTVHFVYVFAMKKVYNLIGISA